MTNDIKCSCGSYAINIDPEKKYCDVCFWKNKYFNLLKKFQRWKNE